MLALSQIRAELRAFVERRRPEFLEEFDRALPSLLTPAIHLRAEELDDDALPVGASRIGGRPDLGSRGWPLDLGEPMHFWVQFNLADVHPFDLDGVLPSKGLLSFFVGPRFVRIDGDLPMEIRFEPDLSALRRAPVALDELDEEDGSPIWPHAVTFTGAVHDFNFTTLSWIGGRLDDELLAFYETMEEWTRLRPEGVGLEPPEGGFLLGQGSGLASSGGELIEGPDEVFLLGLTESSAVFSGYDISAGIGFLIPRDALRRREFGAARMELRSTD